MREKNQIDLWIGALLWFSVLMFIPLIFTVPQDERFIMILVGILMAIIIVPLFYGYTELTDEYLVIRLGVFRQRIKYEKIKSIKLCKNWLSSMAMTSKRIEIKEHKKGYVFGTTYIGPKNREEFFYELKRRCYNLEKEENNLYE